jgi:hypothetical protein
MTEKTTWQAGTATLTGGGLDALMILAAMERLEQKLDALRDSIRSKRRARREQKA